MGEHWHRCQRWFKLGVDCPIPHSGDGDESEPEDEEGAANALPQVELKAATAVQQAAMVSQAINVIAVEPEGVALGGTGLEGVPRTAAPVLTPLTVGQGSTPTAIASGGSGMLGTLLMGAFITAVADITRVTKGVTPANILKMPGPPQVKGAIAAGLAVAGLMGSLESAFTSLMGERVGRGAATDRPEQRAEDARPPVPESRNQVVRPARGFLVDLSQMFRGASRDQ